jgi:hypothetical protein
MMHEAGDNYFLELLRGLAFADGAALPRFGLATLALPFLRLTWMGSDSSSDSDSVRSLGEGGSARADEAASLQGETRVGAEVDLQGGAATLRGEIRLGVEGAGVDSRGGADTGADGAATLRGIGLGVGTGLRAGIGLGVVCSAGREGVGSEERAGVDSRGGGGGETEGGGEGGRGGAVLAAR